MVELVGEKPWAEIKVADIVGRAAIARSTFYQLFSSKEDVLLVTMQPMLRVLARRIGNLDWRTDLDRLLSHYWENRPLARAVFGGERASLVERTLRDEISHGIGGDERAAVREMIAIRMAAGRVALIREWVRGEFSAPPKMVVDAIADCV